MFLKDGIADALNEELNGGFGYIITDEMAIEVPEEVGFNSESFIERLIEQDLLTDDDKAKMNETYIYGLDDINQAVPYLKNRLEIDVRQYTNKTELEFITDLYQKTQQKHFVSTPFDYLKVEKDSTLENDNYYSYHTTVKYGLGGKNYRDKFYSVMPMLLNINEQLEAGTSADSLFYQYFNIPTAFFNAYLTDIQNEKRLLVYTEQLPKVVIVPLNETQAETLNMLLFGDASRDNLIEQAKKLVDIGLVKSLNAEFIDDFIVNYQEKNLWLNTMDLLVAAKPSNIYFFNSAEGNMLNDWKKAIEKVSSNNLQLTNFTDNLSQVSSQIALEIAKDDETKMIETIDYKGSFVLKGKKISFDIMLEKGNYYNIDIHKFLEAIVKPINTELELSKSLMKLYLDGSFNIYYLNNTQSQYLEEEMGGFLE